MIPLIARRDGDARLAAETALSAYKKVPGVGPRAVKVGNAAVYALSQMVGPEAMAQLAMLKVRIQVEIDDLVELERRRHGEFLW